MRQESDPASQIISLNAAATGTDAVLRDVLQNDRNVRAYVDTETGGLLRRQHAGHLRHGAARGLPLVQRAGHRGAHRTLQEHALEYLAKSSGYESLDEMVGAKLRDYSA